MFTIILKYHNAKVFCFLCFLSFFHFVIGIQQMKETTQDPEIYIKYIQDKVIQEEEKIKLCNKSNITNIVVGLGNNEVKVIFKLRDEKFQRCFEYFKIYLEKDRRIIKKVKIHYLQDKQKSVSYTFVSIPCGIYEVFIRPCYNDNDMSCPLFRWSYSNPVNVTSEDCLGISKNKTISSKNKIEEIIIISSVVAFIFLGIICGLASYYYLSGKQKPNKPENNTSASEYKYGKINSLEDKKTEIKSLYIYIFHPYNNCEDQDEQRTLESKVEELKNLLTLLLQHLFDANLKGEQKSIYFSIKTIQSELPKILFNVDDWLKDALDEKGKNGILRKIILVESEKERKTEDNQENSIYFDIIDKLRSNKSRNSGGYDSLFIVRLHDIGFNHRSRDENFHGSSNSFIIPQRRKYFNFFQSCLNITPGPSFYNPENYFPISVMPTYSKELEGMVRGCRYYIYTHLVDLCINLCSGTSLKVLEDEKIAKSLIQHHVDEYLNLVQNI